jgi:peptidoglycan/xylan/chitin deacetylase (PgdA/CDA1 family)
MSGLLRATFTLATGLAVGSWLGVGQPSVDRLRTLAERAVERAIDVPPTPTPGSSSGAPAADGSAQAPPEPERAIEFGPLPQQRDPGSVPSRAPWPSLNPDASLARAWLLAEGAHHEPGDGHRLVTLTFDDGPFLETTPKVLRLLKRYHAHATFFVVGQYLDGKDRRAAATRRLLQRIVDEGHLVGNHTRDHAHLAEISHTKVLEQIDDCASLVERAIGKRPILFRPPYGELDEFGSAAARERGLDVTLWSVAVEDMTRDDSHEMFRELTAQLEHKEGGMVLLHDIKPSSIVALAELLAWLRDRPWNPKYPSRAGYEIVDMPTYLEATQASPQPYESRVELSRAREAAARLRHKEPPRVDIPGEG